MSGSKFSLKRVNPFTTPALGALETGKPGARDLVMLDIEFKYQFLDDTGAAFHEYRIPGNRDIQNCGGYIDKLGLYRDPALFAYLQENGVSEASLAASPFHILNTRSPKLDFLLLELIKHLRNELGLERISFFDHGCTVGEHFDMLDIMLRAEKVGHAADIIDYTGLDQSQLALAAARVLHADIAKEQFKLIQAEGAAFEVPDSAHDLSMTVGVVNHVADPLIALEKVLRLTRHASVMAVWVTAEDEGFWVTNHSGFGHYFFSQRDLVRLQDVHPNGRFLIYEFIPELEDSQQGSYIGVGMERLQRLGCYHLIYTTLDNPPLDLPILAN